MVMSTAAPTSVWKQIGFTSLWGSEAGDWRLEHKYHTQTGHTSLSDYYKHFFFSLSPSNNILTSIRFSDPMPIIDDRFTIRSADPIIALIDSTTFSVTRVT